MKLLQPLGKRYYAASHLPEYLAPLLELTLRLYLASVFFKSGLTKIQSWDSTLYLFSDVYQVPLLSSEVAAYLATGAELGLSVLLALGLFGRFAAAGLFMLNGVAVISYADLSPAGLNQHLSWGMLLTVLLILSRNFWSADYYLERWLLSR
jgi:putative oxidoreductase